MNLTTRAGHARDPLSFTGLVLAFLLIAAANPTLADDPPEEGPILRIQSGTLNINGDQYTRVLPINPSFTSLHKILDKIQGNGLDEIILKGPGNQRYIAFGQFGALNTRNKLQIGYLGNLNEEHQLEVEHINDEVNTPMEGFFSAYKDLKNFIPSGEGTDGVPIAGIASLAGLGYVGREVIKQAALVEGAAGRITGEVLKRGLSTGAFNLLRGAPWIAAGLLVGWPALKAGWTWLRGVFDQNSYTISMLVGRDAQEINRPIRLHESQRREMEWQDIGDRFFGVTSGGLNSVNAVGGDILDGETPVADEPNADDVLFGN